MLPKIAIVAATGTINAVGRDRLDLAAYQEVGTRIDPAELIARIPEARAVARLDLIPGAGFEGPSASLDDLVSFTRLINSAAQRRSVSGVVVSKGTNSLEEFAYAAHLSIHSSKPIVFVGAMRPASAVSADGDLNLLRAIQVAANSGARGHGVLILLNDTILSARDATKGATYRLHAFTGRDLGPLGFADADGQIAFSHRQLRRHTDRSLFDIDLMATMPRVDIVVSYLGADGALIEAAAKAGARGLVAAGMGAGFPTGAEMGALRRARDHGITVCIASRVGSGRVVARPALVKDGFIVADNLVPWKARILLAFALAAGLTRPQIEH
ncbi:MAG TPA: asparaginase, partial [Candidatus Limnocylindria bacterium]|nr:asparaginase [Candidatus Limnocylindria bacterium]